MDAEQGSLRGADGPLDSEARSSDEEARASPPEQLATDEKKPTPSSQMFGKRSAYTLMFGLLLLAVLVAVGHHLFYVYLDGRELNEVVLPQTWVIRVGNAFAFLFKLSLVSAIGVAYAQGFWFFVRRKDIEIRSLDAMFGVLYNPALFLNLDLFYKTTWLSGLAAISWILPITAVFSPGALTGCPHLIRLLNVSNHSAKVNRLQSHGAPPFWP